MASGEPSLYSSPPVMTPKLRQSTISKIFQEDTQDGKSHTDFILRTSQGSAIDMPWPLSPSDPFELLGYRGR